MINDNKKLSLFPYEKSYFILYYYKILFKNLFYLKNKKKVFKISFSIIFFKYSIKKSSYIIHYAYFAYL